MQNVTLLVARALLSALFIASGIDKLATYGAAAKLLAAQGAAPGLLPILIAIELGCGLAVVCGLATRWTALILCIYSIVAAFAAHADAGDHALWLHVTRDLTIAGGFLVLAACGPGALSLDAWRKRRRQRQKLFF